MGSNFTYQEMVAQRERQLCVPLDVKATNDIIDHIMQVIALIIHKHLLGE